MTPDPDPPTGPHPTLRTDMDSPEAASKSLSAKISSGRRANSAGNSSCFACGRTDHWLKDCTQRSKQIRNSVISHLQKHSTSSVLLTLVNQLSTRDSAESGTSEEDRLIHTLQVSGSVSESPGQIEGQEELHSDQESNPDDIEDEHIIEDLFF
jgi:Zinc knuckle